MTRKQKRFAIIGGGLSVIGIAAALVLTAMQDSIVFFYSPTEIEARLAEGTIAPQQPLRVGGLVKEGTLRHEGETYVFSVTDLTSTIQIAYGGLLPDLFREGQGVVAEGVLGPDNVFAAREVLAKHDETYMPREVADALKKSGQWQPE